MAKQSTKKTETAQPQSRGEFMAARREELVAAGELPAHETDAPAGYGEPVKQKKTGERPAEPTAEEAAAMEADAAFEAWFQDVCARFDAAGGDWVGYGEQLKTLDEGSFRAAFAGGISAEEIVQSEFDANA